MKDAPSGTAMKMAQVIASVSVGISTRSASTTGRG